MVGLVIPGWGTVMPVTQRRWLLGSILTPAHPFSPTVESWARSKRKASGVFL